MLSETLLFRLFLGYGVLVQASDFERNTNEYAIRLSFPGPTPEINLLTFWLTTKSAKHTKGMPILKSYYHNAWCIQVGVTLPIRAS